jgi:hypothetical protein
VPDEQGSARGPSSLTGPTWTRRLAAKGPHEIGDGRADLDRTVFLDEMDAFHRDFRLIRPGSVQPSAPSKGIRRSQSFGRCADPSSFRAHYCRFGFVLFKHQGQRNHDKAQDTDEPRDVDVRQHIGLGDYRVWSRFSGGPFASRSAEVMRSCPLLFIGLRGQVPCSLPQLSSSFQVLQVRARA